MDACAKCGAARHDLEAELEARVTALLQTCDRSRTTLRQLLRRLRLEGGSGDGGLRFSDKQLQEELDWQLSQFASQHDAGENLLMIQNEKLLLQAQSQPCYAV